jgi:hypothetical protein
VLAEIDRSCAHADIELEGYLKVWEAMHPDALVERLSPARPALDRPGVVELQRDVSPS